MIHAVRNRYLTRRPQLNTEEIHAGFEVDKVGMGVVFPPYNSGFPYQCHSTNVS
jgi:hypothetical protein